MANADKNILITPSRGANAEPTIVFTGFDNAPITLRILDDGTLSFEGTAGQLFSISDGLSGTIFSVNDISGIPSIEVTDTGFVKLAETSGRVAIATSIDDGSSKLAANGFIYSYGNLSNAASYERVEIGQGLSGVAATDFAILQRSAGSGTVRPFYVGTTGSSILGFITAGTTRWNINTAGHILSNSDNNYDIGASGASRPRHVYIGSNLTVGGSILNNLSIFGATTSAQLAGIITDETGSGNLVFNTSPTVTSPAITGGSINNATVGATTRNTGAFTTLLASGQVTANAGTNSTSTGTGTILVTGGIGVSGNVYASRLASTVASGTAPLIVDSTTQVTNLNASLLIGSTWVSPGAIGSTTRSSGAFTTLLASSQVTANAGINSTSTGTGTIVITGGIGVSANVYASRLISTVSTGTAPLIVSSTTKVTNLNVDLLDGFNSDQANSASTVVVRTSTGNIDGNVFTGTATSAQYSDLAENYVADAPYEAGTVLEFGGFFEVTIASDYTTRVAGVVSTAPAHLMNNLAEGVNLVPLALQGRVPCKVIGLVDKGDMMVSAGDGKARAESNPKVGTVIGKALEDFHGDEGVIEVVVGRV